MLENKLQKYFKFSTFRPGQKEIVETILQGRDVLALMPTGGGKSLCYQLPALMTEKLSLVISPLIALMKDQVDVLNKRGIPAVFINSTLSKEEVAEKMEEIKSGKIKILYLAPERLNNPQFQNFLSQLDIFLFSVDEAHCVSQWGHDFRPDYLKIKKYIQKFKSRPIVAAFTATATPEVADDIVERLSLQNPKIFIRGFDRPNLKFLVQANLKTRERYDEVLRIVKSLTGSGIVYTLSRKEAETIARFLKNNAITAVAYHAGMVAKKREKVQDDFMKNKIQVIVATVAFGMGVDKADVRFVIHAGMPGSLESYYQEAGRSGRDGKKAFCVLLHAKKDVNTHKFFIRKNKSEMIREGKEDEEIDRVTSLKYNHLEKMVEYSTRKKCRRRMILEYFNDPKLKDNAENCHGCDVCLGWKVNKIKQQNNKLTQKKGFLSSTVEKTVYLYNKQFTYQQIAQKRSLGKTTILNHLIEWYKMGGELKIAEFISPQEEEKIKSVIIKSSLAKKLKPIKEKLPLEISYEKIKLMLVKMEKEK